MADIKHCKVLKPFDRNDVVGAVIPMSEAGFERFTRSAKHRDRIELLATEKPNGDILDASGALVIPAKSRKDKSKDGTVAFDALNLPPPPKAKKTDG